MRVPRRLVVSMGVTNHDLMLELYFILCLSDRVLDIVVSLLWCQGFA